MTDNQQLSKWTVVGRSDNTTRYVWDVEESFPTTGEAEITIGDLRIGLNFGFPHERRYALGFLFGFRNPQTDIDRCLFRRCIRQGDVVLDIGANIGVTAAEAIACGASHVICVEPEDNLVKRLKQLEKLYPDRISVWHCALGAREGTAELLLSSAHNQGHTISSMMTALFPNIFDGKSQEVKISTIDNISLYSPSLVWKIDAEGVEAEVIRGAQRTLECWPPRVILAELYDPIADEVVALLPGYSVQRAALTRRDYSLDLLDRVGGPLPDEYCPISPTYVFTRASST